MEITFAKPYNWIARDQSGKVFLYTKKPRWYKSNQSWNNDKDMLIREFHDHSIIFPKSFTNCEAKDSLTYIGE